MPQRRPGELTTGPGGGCMALFFVPFLVIGLVSAFNGAVRQHQIGLVIFGSVFSLVGLFGLLAGLRTLVGPSKMRSPLSAPKVPLSWKESPWFPALKGRAVSNRGHIRIAPETKPAGELFSLIVLSVVFNAITWGMILVWKHPKFPITAFQFVFALAGAFLVVMTVRQLLRVLLVGNTSVELAAEPLAPGQTTDVYLYQNGDFEVESVTLRLLCREIAEYRAGTDRMIVKETVHNQEITTVRNTRARQDSAMLQTQLTIPEDAVPSFKAPNNSIVWTIEVKMSLPGRPDIDDQYVLRVGAEQA